MGFTHSSSRISPSSAGPERKILYIFRLNLGADGTGAVRLLSLSARLPCKMLLSVLLH